MEEFIKFFNVTGPWVGILLGFWIILNVIGEICSKTGKVVPAFMSIVTAHRKRKAKKEEKDNLLRDVKTLLSEVNGHYSEDNITKRNDWMNWVNSRAQVYDESVDDLRALHKALEENNTLTLDLYINYNRNRIIDFAGQIYKNDRPYSKEEFNRIFKTYEAYELILQKYHMSNGEVETSMHEIKEDYARRIREHDFLEDMKYSNK